MYSLRHKHHRRYLWYGITVIGIVLMGAGLVYVRSLRADTKLTQSKPLTYYVPATATPTTKIEKPLFTLAIPASWASTPPPDTPYTTYSWHGVGTGDDSARRLDVYVDKVPLALAVNRLTPVEVTGDRLQTTGLTSDNCSNFTDRSTMSQTTAVAPAKWNNVNFLCDLGNYERDVVAIGSTEGVNTITLVGSTTGAHHVLLVYTDNSASPSFAIFSAIIQSFRLR